MKPQYKFFNNARYAFEGLITLIKEEKSFKIEIFIIIPLILISLFMPVTLITHILLVLSLLLILLVEALNSAIERCVDLNTQEFHILAKGAKDCGSAAVCISITMAVIVWVFTIIDIFLS